MDGVSLGNDAGYAPPMPILGHCDIEDSAMIQLELYPKPRQCVAVGAPL